MPRLGTGMPLSAGLAQEAVLTIEDFVWEIVSSGNITPLDTSGSLIDTSKVWDYDGTDIMIEADTEDEGLWEDFSELITNGYFDDATGWTKSSTSSATQEIVAGALRMYTGTSGDNSNSMSTTSASGSEGNVYRLNITASNYVNGTYGYIRLDGAYDASNVISFEAGTQSVYFTAYRDFTSIQFFAGSHSAYYTIDDVSLVEYAITPLDV